MDSLKRERFQVGADLFKALSHPARLELLEILAEGPRCVCDLAGTLGLTASAASKFLSQLREAGLIELERKGLQVEYHIVTPCVLKVTDCAISSIMAKRPKQAFHS